MEITELKTKEYIDQIKKRTIKQIDLDKIILFGSYARGDYNSDSDIDIVFIIDDKSENKRNIKHKIDNILKDRFLPIDIIIYTKDEFRNKENIVGTLPYTIIREGEILYDKRSTN